VDKRYKERRENFERKTEREIVMDKGESLKNRKGKKRVG
jgi:hypothetical protein